MLFQQFAISPQFFMYTSLFIVAYLLIEYGVNKITLRNLAVFFALSLLYSSIYILPLVEFNSHAVRSAYLSYGYSDQMASRAIDIVQLVLFNSGANSIRLYVGAVVLSVILIGLVQKKSKKDFLLVALAVTFYLASTNSMLFAPIIRVLPGLNEMRWHSRANEIIVFILVILVVK